MSYEIPSTCPPALAKLVKFFHTPAAVAKQADLSDGVLYKIALGQMPLSQGVADKLATLQAKVNAGKVKRPKDLKKNIDYTKYPPLIRELVKKTGGLGSAARAMGYATDYVLRRVGEGHSTFDDALKQRVQDALDGKPPVAAAPEVDLDKYTLGIAIVLARPAHFERIYELGEALGGLCVFKKSSSLGWLAIFKMKTDKLKVFKRVGARDGDILCP